MIRILSDLHVYDDRTQVRDLRQLEPLLAGVETLVINGDSCEIRHGIAAGRSGELQEFFRQRVPRVVFVTGNHDPDISGTHELLLAEDRVWVTHGDIFFEDLTPWSHLRPEIWRRVQALLAEVPVARRDDLAVKFHIARAVARSLPETIDPAQSGWRARARRFRYTFFPPRQVLAMLRAWCELPGRAAALASAQRPVAQVVVTGHVHFPGVWRRTGQPVVINTGSFFSPLGGHLVDLAGEQVQVRRIQRRRGDFYPGREIATISLRADGSGLTRRG